VRTSEKLVRLKGGGRGRVGSGEERGGNEKGPSSIGRGQREGRAVMSGSGRPYPSLTPPLHPCDAARRCCDEAGEENESAGHVQLRRSARSGFRDGE